MPSRARSQPSSRRLHGAPGGGGDPGAAAHSRAGAPSGAPSGGSGGIRPVLLIFITLMSAYLAYSAFALQVSKYNDSRLRLSSSDSFAAKSLAQRGATPRRSALAKAPFETRARATLESVQKMKRREEQGEGQKRQTATSLDTRLQGKDGADGVELWGALVMDGTRNVQPNAQACRATCEQHLALNGDAGCNTWVYCGHRDKCSSSQGSCWLKRIDDPRKAEVRETGEHVMWTSGTIVTAPPQVKQKSSSSSSSSSAEASESVDETFAEALDGEGGADALHFVITSNGSPYVNIQTRSLYHSYLAAKRRANADDASFLGGFTRILHRRNYDALMREVPTVRVNPLHVACDTWCEFPVADRPDAFRKWLMHSRDSRRFRYILLGESDYIVIRPFPSIKVRATLAEYDGICFHYDYINPMYGGLESKLRDMARIAGDIKLPENIQDVYASGPAPVILTHEGWAKVTPLWQAFTKAIEDTPHIKQTLGWVREMYAWSAAAASVGLKVQQQDRGSTVLIAQPPADDTADDACMYHYTWGTELKDAQGNLVWAWDKRKFTAADTSFKLPTLPMPPTEGTYTQQFPSTRQAKSELLVTLADMIGRMNAAARDLPALKPCGWELLPPCEY